VPKELKDFIKAMAQSVIDATSELIDANTDRGVFINPPASSVSNVEDWVESHDGFLPVTRIAFDIAVTEESGKSGDVGGKLKVAVVEMGAGGKVTSADPKISRISFDLRLALPAQPTPRKERPPATGYVRGIV
jgi:hypothetical protein